MTARHRQERSRSGGAARRSWVTLCVLLAGCASSPDRFYALNVATGAQRAQAPGAGDAGAGAPIQPVRLAVTVPAAVDRNEMVMESGANAVAIFEHERWAAPLAGQVRQILGRDLQARRGDLLVGERVEAGVATLALDVDLVRMTARRGESAVIEAQWRIHAAAGADRLGSGVFAAPLRIADFADMAAAYSADLDLLAERLIQEISRR